MSFRPVNDYNTASGNINGVAAGTITAGNSLVMDGVEMGTLSATYSVDVETSTLTMAAVWEVSKDGSTWKRVSSSTQNAAEVVLATGTAGADATVERVVPAPASVYAFKYVRAGVLSAVAAGNTVDTYSIGYNFVKRGFR